MSNVPRPGNSGYAADGAGFHKNVQHHWNVICNECDGLSLRMDGNPPPILSHYSIPRTEMLINAAVQRRRIMKYGLYL